MQELIESIKGGDTSRLGELYDRNRGFLYRLATRYLGVDKVVTLDDLMQAGFLGLAAAVDAWDPARGAWSTIAHFHVRKAMRDAVGLRGRQRPHLEAISLDEPMPGDEDGDSSRLDTLTDESLPDADEAMIEDERRQALHEALGRLAPDRADAVRLHDLEGFTYESASEQMGVTIQQAHNLRGYALRDLRRDWKLEKALDDETRFHAHKGVTAFLSDWTSATEAAAMWRIERESAYEQWKSRYEERIKELATEGPPA